MPSAAVITSATVDLYYRSNNNNDTACWYMEAYNGATLLGTHGSSGSPLSCNFANSHPADNVPLAELTSVTNANNLTLRVYMRDAGSKKTQIDLARLNVAYYLD